MHLQVCIYHTHTDIAQLVLHRERLPRTANSAGGGEAVGTEEHIPVCEAAVALGSAEV